MSCGDSPGFTVSTVCGVSIDCCVCAGWTLNRVQTDGDSPSLTADTVCGVCIDWCVCVQVELWRVHTDGDSPGLTADTVCGQATQPRVLQTLITYRRIWSKEAAKSKSVGHWGNYSPLVYHFLTIERSIWLYSRTGCVQGSLDWHFGLALWSAVFHVILKWLWMFCVVYSMCVNLPCDFFTGRGWQRCCDRHILRNSHENSLQLLDSLPQKVSFVSVAKNLCVCVCVLLLLSFLYMFRMCACKNSNRNW